MSKVAAGELWKLIGDYHECPTSGPKRRLMQYMVEHASQIAVQLDQLRWLHEHMVSFRFCDDEGDCIYEQELPCSETPIADAIVEACEAYELEPESGTNVVLESKGDA